MKLSIIDIEGCLGYIVLCEGLKAKEHVLLLARVLESDLHMEGVMVQTDDLAEDIELALADLDKYDWERVVFSVKDGEMILSKDNNLI
ncbi:hypothetical protein QRE62_03520 (plasmid) [Bacillus mycoides]|uniref:hypothetical protein n=1 Tax=Bacillus mycoides TaxID=1405 RepID=UPI002570D3C8|nr:hypothetical protein [Bacillus mycoides]WJE74203.1 hypothetical protein QRE62_03520 [Bacillus mycoides]